VKRLRKARFIRAVAKVVCALLFIPQLLAWTTLQSAAQAPAHLTVVVVDFNNQSGVGGPLLGRRAAAAMSLQLRQSDNWDPVNQNEVDLKIASLSLHAPFDRSDLERLAHALDAQAVLIGHITSASVSNNPAQASVRIVVELLDVGAGELINGAVATGTASHIGLENASDVLLDEALSKAAFDARQTMERYQLPQGTVQNTTVIGSCTGGGGTEDALVNVGARQGVHEGMRFVVLRGHEVVGYMNASRVDPDKTTARITQNFRGIKPEDIARVIYTLPEGADVGPAANQPQSQVVQPNVTPKQSAHHRNYTGMVRTFAALGLLAGVAALIGNKSGGTSAFNIRAQATRVAGQPAASSAGVLITWARPHQIPPNAIIQYQVYRVDPTMGAPVLIGIAYEASRSWVDTTNATMVNNFFIGTGGDASGPSGPANVPGLTPGNVYQYYIQTIYNEGVSLNAGGTTAGTTAGTTTGTTIGTTAGTTTGTTTTGTTTTGTTTTGTTTTGTTTTGTTTTGTTTTGTTTTGTTTTGTTTTGTTTTGGGATSNSGQGLPLISQPSAFSPTVTPVDPPTLSTPQDRATGVDLTAVTFTWTTVRGADVYSVQVSGDSTNPNSFVEVASALNPSRTAGVTLSATVNIASRFAGRPLLVWQVGAKNSQDGNAPAPNGYVLSDVRSFTPAQAATASVRFNLNGASAALNPTRSNRIVSGHRGGKSR
jgi:hypothetical protein